MNSMTPSVALPRPGALDAFLRRRLLAQLAPLRDGRLCVRDALGEVWLGDARGELHVTVTINDPAFYRKVAAQGSVGAGESYIQGEWHCDDLVALIQLLVRNRELLDGMEQGPARVAGCCADGTGCTATAVRAAGATSPPTTTWATISSPCSCRLT